MSLEKKEKCDKVINSLFICFFIGSFYLFSVFSNITFLFYSSSSHYISLIFSNTFSWYWYQSQNIHSFFCIEYFNFHKFTNPRIFQMQVFFAVLLLSIFFLFSFNSVKCHILTVCTDTFILFHCILSVKLV